MMVVTVWRILLFSESPDIIDNYTIWQGSFVGATGLVAGFGGFCRWGHQAYRGSNQMLAIPTGHFLSR